MGHTLNQPFALYAAYMQLLNRHARLGRQPDHSFWRECVEQGLDLMEHVVEHGLSQGVAMPSLDALAWHHLRRRRPA